MCSDKLLLNKHKFKPTNLINLHPIRSTSDIRLVDFTIKWKIIGKLLLVEIWPPRPHSKGPLLACWVYNLDCKQYRKLTPFTNLTNWCAMSQDLSGQQYTGWKILLLDYHQKTSTTNLTTAFIIRRKKTYNFRWLIQSIRLQETRSCSEQFISKQTRQK